MTHPESPSSGDLNALLGEIVREEIAAGIYDAYRADRQDFAARVRKGKTGYIARVADECDIFATSELPLLPHLYVGDETMIEIERVDPDTLKSVSLSVANACRIGVITSTPERFRCRTDFTVEQVELVYKHAHLLGSMVLDPYV